MKKYALILYLLIGISGLAQVSCNGDDESEEWLINQEDVLNGGPGKDGIPSVDNPNFISVNEVDFLASDDLVIGLKVGEEVRAYPHEILDWHEIVNDVVGTEGVAITYCPLTGTGIGWDAEVNGVKTTFGVSGLLFNTNLMPYDRNSNSTWSQMRLDCVNGPLIGRAIKTVQLTEIPWALWSTIFPNSKVMSTNTGFSRSYGQYPYGEYKTNESILFPLAITDDRVSVKERVLGIQEANGSLVFRFNSFNEPGKVTVHKTIFNGKNIVALGSQEENFLIAFENNINGAPANFNAIERAGNIIAEDENGNRINLFGEIVAGPAVGSRLPAVTSYIGYWLGWSNFQPGVAIFQP